MSPHSQRRFNRGKNQRRFPTLAVVIISLIALVAVVVGYTMTRGGGDEDTQQPVSVTFPIPISGVKVPADTTIGVVLTSGSSEGGQWYLPAHGVSVAHYRLGLGGNDLEVVAVDDGGSRNGSVEAIKELLAQDVAGIVYASTGEHMRPGLGLASTEEVPVILPYDTSTTWPGIYTIAPSTESVIEVINEELEGFAHSVQVIPEGTDPADAVATETMEINPKDVTEGVEDLVLRTSVDPAAHGAYEGAEDLESSQEFQDTSSQPRIEALFIDGDARFTADVLTGLVARGVKIPMIVGSDALTPAFVSRVVDSDGVVPPGVITVGSAHQDSLALRNDAPGRAMSAFLQAVRQTGQMVDGTDLMGESDFTQAQVWADASSHDALVALTHAVARAKSTDPKAVGEALDGLKLGKNDAIVGSDLDFSEPQAAVEPASALFSTNQRLGLRAVDAQEFTVTFSGRSDEH